MNGRIVLTALAGALLASAPVEAATLRAPPGALSCAGCHGLARAKPAVIPPIAGRPAADLVARLEAYRTGAAPSTVMGRIVRGFTPEEIGAIARWFSAQK